VPAGYPQQSYTQPFAYPDAPERPLPRPDGQDRRQPPDGAEHGTRIIEVPSASGDRDTGPQAIITQPNLARSSQVMALGTIASRATGFLRTFVLVAALGSRTLADAYNNSNTLPNTVYYLMLGGIFTSVVVPMLVRAAKEDPDRGVGYAERIFTLGVISLLLITAAAMALAGPLVDLYAGNISDAREHTLMVIFAYFFIPQIFFYGMDSLLGAILNVRGRFGPNMWTPVINNVVVILVGVLYIVTIGLNKTADNIPASGIQLLAIGTTLGIVIQSICLFPILRRAGFSMRLRWDLRRREIAEIGLMAGWMFGYVASQWLGNLIVQRVANAAANSAANPPHGHPAVYGVGYSAYSYAWQLFQLPYAIVGISVISALLPRMSGHATDRRYSLVRDDFSKGVRLGHRGPGGRVPRGARAAAVHAAVRLGQQHGGERAVHRRGVRRVLPRPGGVHADPAPAACFLLVPGEQDAGDHRHGDAHRRRDRGSGRAVRAAGDAHRDRARGRLQPGDADRRDHRLAAAAAPHRQPGRLADHPVAGPDAHRHAARARVHLRHDGGRGVVHAPGQGVRPADHRDRRRRRAAALRDLRAAPRH
jgi:O-antigen/teichoic acid export membrane protein